MVLKYAFICALLNWTCVNCEWDLLTQRFDCRMLLDGRTQVLLLHCPSSRNAYHYYKDWRCDATEAFSLHSHGPASRILLIYIYSPQWRLDECNLAPQVYVFWFTLLLMVWFLNRFWSAFYKEREETFSLTLLFVKYSWKALEMN